MSASSGSNADLTQIVPSLSVKHTLSNRSSKVSAMKYWVGGFVLCCGRTSSK